ncbi:MAG: RHS repeat-associated core domain-containing protein [Kofleriaceae bacterium]
MSRLLRVVVTVLSFAPTAIADIDNRGAYTDRVDIVVPPYHGLEPTLALVYNSQSTGGIAGAGWHLEGGSAIMRTGKNGGVPSFTSEDLFVLDGVELLPCSASPASASCRTGGTHATRVDDFRRIKENSNNTWTVWGRNGTQRHYQQIGVLDGWPRWSIASVVDIHGNTVTYGYNCIANDRDCYLERIQYGDGVACSPTDDVTTGTDIIFRYTAREDAATYATGLQLARVGKRLQTIEVRFGGRQVRAYHVDYAASLQTSNSLASRVRVEGATDATLAPGDAPLHAFQSASESLATPWEDQPAVELGESAWPTNDPSEQAFDQATSLLYDIEANDGGDNPWFAADLNLDGRADAIGLFPSAGHMVELRSAIARAGGGFDITTQETPWINNSAWDNPRWLRYQVADLNGDRRSDIVILRNPGGEGYEITTHVALSNGAGGFDVLPDRTIPVMGWAFKSTERRARNRWLSGDVDGDGRSDMVAIEWQWRCTPEVAAMCGCTPDAAPEQICEHAAITTGRSLGDGSFVWKTEQTPWSMKEPDDPHWHVGDHDGDGRADVIRVEQENSTTPYMRARLSVAQSRGDGTFAFHSQDTGVSYHSPLYRLFDRNIRGGHDRTLIGDFNADGRTDVVLFGEYTVPNSFNRIVINTAFSTGVDGKFETIETRTAISSLQLNSTHPGRPDQNFNKWFVADLDGDDASDLVITSHDSWGAYSPGNPLDPRTPPTYATLAAPLTPERARVQITRLISDHRGGWVHQGSRVRSDWELTCYEIDGYRNNCEGDTYYDLLPGDVNADGRDDLVYIGRNWKGDGTLRFSADLTTMPYVVRRHDVWRSTDVDGDGRSDLIAIQAASPGFMVTTRLQRGTAPVVMEEQGTAYLTDIELPPDASQSSWRVVDAGGPDGAPDGKADLVLIEVGENGQQRLHVYLGNGDATWNRPAKPQYVATHPPGERGAWRTMDVNGDGATDFVNLARTDTPGLQVLTVLSNGNGTVRGHHIGPVFDRTTPPTASGEPGPLGSVARTMIDRWEVADINGDQRDDLYQLDYQSIGFGTIMRTLIATDNGWRQRAYPLGATPRLVQHYHPADINGDGSADLVHLEVLADPRRLVVRGLVSKGSGDFEVVSWNPFPLTSAVALDARAPIITDLDGDGRSDIVIATEVNGSTRFMTLWNVATGWKLAPEVTLAATTEGRTGRWSRFELTGGGVELVSATRGTLDVVRALVPRDEMIVRWNGLGARTAIQYGSSEGHHADMPIGNALRIVERLTHTDTTNPTAPARIDELEVTRARYSRTHHQALGFEAVTSRDPSGKTFDLYSFSDACGAQLRGTERHDLNGKRIAHSATSFTAPGPGAAVCLVAYQTNYECEGDPSCRITRDSFEYDAYGNAVRHTEHGDMSTLLDDRRTDRPPVPNTTAYIVDKPAYTNVSSYETGAWTVVAQTLHMYDTNALHTSPPTKGDLTESHAWDDVDQTYRVTRTEYQSNGLPTRSFAPQTTASPTGVWSQTLYDCNYKRYPIGHCTAEGCTYTRWDKGLGAKTGHTDLGSYFTDYDIDVLGRTVRVHNPDGGVATMAYPTLLDLGTTAQRMRGEVTDGSSDGMWNVTYLDGHGRVARSMDETGDVAALTYADDTVTATTTYGSGAASNVRSFEYDTLGRSRGITVAAGTPGMARMRTDIFVGGWTEIDAMGNDRTYFTDGHGRVVSVRDRLRDCEGWDGEWTNPLQCGGAYHFTHYVYNALDQITDIIDDAGAVTHFERDSLQRISEKCDPNSGCWQYEYFADGRVASQTDADQRRVDFEYDAAGRTRLQTFSQSGEPSDRHVEMFYDVDPLTLKRAGNSQGRLTRVVDTRDGEKTIVDTYRYDAMGHIDRHKRCVDTDCVEMGFSYDTVGRLVEVTYPDRRGELTVDSERVPYTYDEVGRVKTVGDYVKGIVYAGGQRESVDYGNGVVTKFTRNAHRAWVEQIEARRVSGSLVKLGYSFDAAGRVRSHSSENLATINWTYRYDSLDRLTTIRGSDVAHHQDLKYTPTGRIDVNSKIGAYHYDDPKHAHAVTRTEAGDQLTYDNGGHLLKSNSVEVTWGTDGMPRLLKNTTTGAKVNVAYDVNEQRVVRTGPNGTTISFNPFVEKLPSGELVSYYLLEGRRIARRDEAGTNYYTYDLQDNVRLVTDEDGDEVARYDYSPFGTTISSTGAIANDVTLANGRSDEDLPLVDMGARFYDPRLGRFISADTIVPDPFDSQALDQYAYVLNSPPNYTDPTGHAPDAITDRENGAPTNLVDYIQVEFGQMRAKPHAKTSGTEGKQGITIGSRSFGLFDETEMAGILATYDEMESSTASDAYDLLVSRKRAPAIPKFTVTAQDLRDSLYRGAPFDPCRHGPCMGTSDGRIQSMGERAALRAENEHYRQFGSETTQERVERGFNAWMGGFIFLNSLGGIKVTKTGPARPSYRFTFSMDKVWRPHFWESTRARVQEAAGYNNRTGFFTCRHCGKRTNQGQIDHTGWPWVHRFTEALLMARGTGMRTPALKEFLRAEYQRDVELICSVCNNQRSDQGNEFARGVWKFLLGGD